MYMLPKVSRVSCILFIVIYIAAANYKSNVSKQNSHSQPLNSQLFNLQSLPSPEPALMCFTFPALGFVEKNCFDQLARPRESWESANCFLQYHRNLKIVGPTTMVLLQPSNQVWLVHWKSTLCHRHFVGLDTAIDTPCFVVPRHVASRNIVACKYVFWKQHNKYIHNNGGGG